MKPYDILLDYTKQTKIVDYCLLGAQLLIFFLTRIIHVINHLIIYHKSFNIN